jgi:hypothetical protein
MQVLKDYIKSQAMFKKVNLQDGAEHILTLVDAKVSTIRDNFSKENIEGIRLTVKEGENTKSIFTTGATLICALANLEANDVFKVQMIKYEGDNDIELTRYDVWKKIGEEFVPIEEPAEETAE